MYLNMFFKNFLPFCKKVIWPDNSDSGLAAILNGLSIMTNALIAFVIIIL